MIRQRHRQTDRQTDDMPSQDRALRYSASRGKNAKTRICVTLRQTFGAIRVARLLRNVLLLLLLLPACRGVAHVSSLLSACDYSSPNASSCFDAFTTCTCPSKCFPAVRFQAFLDVGVHQAKRCR